MGFLDKINAVWQKVGLVQRALLAALVLTCILTAVLLTRWATRPEMRLLFGNLSLEQASKIADKISEQNIPYEIRGGGSSIFVPADKVHELRALAAREGLLPKSGEPGYEIFDNEKLGVSPLVQKMNYNRALQGELARTIQVFDGVQYARVHIVRPEQTLFTGGEQKATASVMLQLKPGWQISQSTVAAIANLVAGAVEGLTPEQVTVADSQGHILSQAGKLDSHAAGANTYLEYQNAVETEMANRLQQALERVLGPNRSTVMVKAAIDMNSESIVRKTYEKGIPVEETIDETSTIKQSAGSSSEEGGSNTPSSTEKKGTTTTQYQLPETVTTQTKIPGRVTAWSVSVIVDLSKPSTENPAAGTEQTQQTASPGNENSLLMSVEDVKEIIRTAIGPDLLSEQNLTVKHVPFYRPPAEPIQTGPNWEGLIEIARQLSMGILAVSALLVLRIFTRATAKAAAQPASGAEMMLGGGGMPMLPAGLDSPAAMRRMIAAQLQQNPEQVRTLFSSWLAEEQ
ncbi:MAG TPA: flagellar basal-body MS-ring/collar protein FliF [Anaerohalosphaeraceae bacterium]|nr:flagellar basal-body MS-ring/collar protein FliF [Anaerohalosphaeraceae bacterium]